MYKVFIDGREGTTGLRIYERLAEATDIHLLTLDDAERKDRKKRKAMINESDLTFLCLPDEAARESVSLIEKDSVKIIDASTAHRTEANWVYGFPELGDLFRSGIVDGSRVAVPGCHAGGFIALIHPLIEAGVLSRNAELSCFSVTGYSGGGKKMIAEYESFARNASLDTPRQYATGQNHKHLKEMAAISGLIKKPVFSPIVADFYSGMVVTVPLFRSAVGINPEKLTELYKNAYAGNGVLTVLPHTGENEFVSGNCMSGKDSMEIRVEGNEERFLLTARFDNLGKGASGAALQCMNLMLGRNEFAGLNI